MKASIRDVDVLRSIEPLSVAAYLRASGWKEAEKHEGRYAIWTAPEHSNASVEVLLPLSRELRDYANRMAEVLQTLEVYERRSQIEIIHDISGSSTDVFRLGAEGDQFRDGTLPIEQGIEFLQAGRELLLAAACGAARPQEVYFARKPKKAEEYIKSVRLGQSEHGSYVFAIHSPVVPLPDGPLVATSAEPFARIVTRTLMRATAVVREAAERALPGEGLGGFVDAVSVGVSANLCDALVKLQEGTGASSIRLQMSWAATASRPTTVPPRVIIPAALMPIIGEAGAFLRATHPQPDYILQGRVSRLERLQRSRSGEITIVADISGRSRLIQVDLRPEDYKVALEAHSREWHVRCEGTLIREGRSWTLRDYRNFRIIPPIL
jgi:hypothetical protein